MFELKWSREFSLDKLLDDVYNIITMEIAITSTAKYKASFLPLVMSIFFPTRFYDSDLEELDSVEQKTNQQPQTPHPKPNCMQFFKKKKKVFS